ncbi:MAG: alpha/beta fold hydrolase [Pseudomonas sp.]
MAQYASHCIDAFMLQCGTTVRALRLRYEIHGKLNNERTNAILFPTWFGANHKANTWIIGPGRALDTEKYCVIVVNALGNGQSSSPSNHPDLVQEGRAVPISLHDNVVAQADLVRALGIEKLVAVIGRSMGAQQALQWGCLYPEKMGRIFAFCGTPATSTHNRTLLDGMAAIMEAAGDSEDSVKDALGNIGRVYAAWVLSHEFFNDRTWKDERPEDWISRTILPAFLEFHRHDILSLIKTWQFADISANARFGGNLKNALEAITVPVFLMPISHDLVFPPQDFEECARHLPNSRTTVLYSIWGHRAGAPNSDVADIAELETAIREFLFESRHASA